MITKFAPLMAFILRSIIIFTASMAWTYSQAQQSDATNLAEPTHIIVIIRDTSTMRQYKKNILSTLPDLLFDGLNRQPAGLPIYNTGQDRISVVFAGIRKKSANGKCQFKFSAAPQHFFRTDSDWVLAHPKNKKELLDLLGNSIESTCAFKGRYFSSYLVRTNAISYIQEQLRSTLPNIPAFSGFTIIIVDFDTPSYNISTLRKQGVEDVALALESEKNFPGDFYYMLSPKSWTFTVNSVRYRISSAKSVKSMQAQRSEIDKLRSRLLKNEDQIRNDSKEREKITIALNEATANGEMWKEKHDNLEKELKKTGSFGWLLAVIVVLGLIGAFLISRKLLRPLRFQGSIPER